MILFFSLKRVPSLSNDPRCSRPIVTRQYPDTDSDSKEEIEVLMQGNGAMGQDSPGDPPKMGSASLAANISIYNDIQ